MNRENYTKWVNTMHRQFISMAEVGNAMREQKDNTVTVIDIKHTKIGKSKCHPDDKFDIVVGTAIAWARCKGYEIPELNETPKRWKANTYEVYWEISSSNMEPIGHSHDSSFDDMLYEKNNYFKTFEFADKISKKFRFLLKIAQYHQMFCPDYTPDWDTTNNEMKLYIVYDNLENKYTFDYTYEYDDMVQVYFPNIDTVSKVVDILNEELADTNYKGV